MINVINGLHCFVRFKKIFVFLDFFFKLGNDPVSITINNGKGYESQMFILHTNLSVEKKDLLI